MFRTCMGQWMSYWTGKNGVGKYAVKMRVILQLICFATENIPPIHGNGVHHVFDQDCCLVENLRWVRGYVHFAG